MDRLIEGFRRFRRSYWAGHEERYQALATGGQSPRAMVIGCANSRVDPQIIFQAEPGETFVVRNVGALIPPYAPDAEYHGTSAGLEFAVRSLKVENVVVLGHSGCGGIGALLRGAHDGNDFVVPWMQIAASARERALAAAGNEPERAQRLCELESIQLSLRNLLTFPWVRDGVEEGRIRLHGCYFDIEHGDLLRLGATGKFDPV